MVFLFLDGGPTTPVAHDSKLLGEPDGKGFGIGVATPPIKANTMALLATRGKIKSRRGKDVVDPTEAKRVETQGQDEGKSTATTVARTQRQGSLRPTTPPPKSDAFMEFKQERGSEISRILHENKGRRFLHGYIRLHQSSKNKSLLTAFSIYIHILPHHRLDALTPPLSTFYSDIFKLGCSRGLEIVSVVKPRK